MAIFPSTPIPSYPLNITPTWNTVVSDFDSGTDQRRQKWQFPKYDVTLTYDAKDANAIQILWNFYMARKGAYEDFYFFAPSAPHLAQDHKELFVDVAAGGTIFDIPGKDTSAHAIHVNGDTIYSGYTILYGGGVGDADRVEFDTPAVSGSVITCDFTGYLRIKCRFREDRMTKTQFAYAAFSTGMELKGLAGA